jgi:putative SOS response-associated peptidase YedK
VSSKHFDDDEISTNRTILPALWSIIPKWHKGDYRKHGLTTNNARLEGLTDSKLYKPLLDHGKRCVMVIEGFYEWQTTNPKAKSSERSVYFVHIPQDGSIKIEDKSSWTSCEDVKLMHIAGLFDVWEDDSGDSIYSFTIITYESDKFFNWLHHRTPAILETEEQIRNWLDYEHVSASEALKLIQQPKITMWYQVSSYVNSTRNKLDQCNKPINYKPKTFGKGSILNFVTKQSEATEKKEEESPEKSSKRQKLS